MNSASRLLGIFDAMLSHPVSSNVPTFNVWSAALGVKVLSPGSAEQGTLSIQAFLTELDAVEARLATQGLPGDLYYPSFNRIRGAASQLAWGNDWRGMVGNVNTPDVRLSLAWAAAVLPHEEDEVPSDKLEALAAEFDSLGEALEAVELPPAMRAFVTKQLSAIRGALRLYRVRGVVALKEVVGNAYGAAAMARDSMVAEAASAPQARTVFERLNGGLGRVMSTCDSVDKLNKGSSAMLNMAEGLKNILELTFRAP